MAKLNTTNTAPRIDPVLRHWAKGAFIFQVDANGNYVLQRNTLTFYSVGVDDTIGNFNAVGYDTALPVTNNIDLTSALKQGALSSEFACLLLSCAFMPEAHVRVGVTAAGGLDPAFTTTIVPRVGGLVGDTESQIVDQLITEALRTSQLQLLPAGTNSSCAMFLDIPQLRPAGIGWQNSSLTSSGFQSPAVRYRFGDDMIVFPTRQQQDYQPNRIQLNYPTPQTASQGQVVQLPAGMLARAAGTIVVVDTMCVVDFARIELLNFTAEQLQAMSPAEIAALPRVDPSTADENTIKSYLPVADIDRRKIECFAAQV